MSTDNGPHHPDATDLTRPRTAPAVDVCPLCSVDLNQGSAPEPITEGRASLRLCPRCRSVLATARDDLAPRPAPPRTGRPSVDPMAEMAGALAWDLAEHLAAPSRAATVVDLGAGHGSLLRALDRLGYRVRGCEPSSFLCQMARATHLLGPEVLTNAEPASFLDELRDEEVTVSGFVLWNVLHTQIDPVGLLRRCLELAPAAVCFIAVPPARSDGVADDGSGPEVLTFPTPATIVDLVETLDLSLEAISVTRAEGLRATVRGRDPQIVDLDAVRPVTVDVGELEASYRTLSPAFAQLSPGPKMAEPDDSDDTETATPLR